MTTDPVVHIGHSVVRGARRDEVAVFTGIPYAAGPTGAQRFRAPRPAVLPAEVDAGRSGATAPQPSRFSAGVDLRAIGGPGWQPGEQYLNLNVWTPDASSVGLPVMVFLHGGAFLSGAGSSAGYDGTRFARDGVVLVTLNYRLGISGFGHVPGAPDNRGLLDQIAGLEWVREHIAAFGGDPDRVTVFGESAGALSVGALLAAAPRGLFRRAISQSGGASHAQTRGQAEVVTRAVAGKLGVEATVEAFAEVGDQVLVQTLAEVGGVDLVVDGQLDPLMGLGPLSTVLDGELLGEQPVESVRSGASAEVDLLVGHNRDEMNLYLVGLSEAPVSDAALHAAVARLHPDPQRVVETYRAAGRGGEPGELLSAVGTDHMFAAPTARLARAHARHRGGTWRYEFTWPSPSRQGRLGACHGVELPFVFDGVGRVDYGVLGVDGDDDSARDLARRTHAAWVAFARDGDPGWPRHTREFPAVRRFGVTDDTVTDPDGPERALWNLD